MVGYGLYLADRAVPVGLERLSPHPFGCSLRGDEALGVVQVQDLPQVIDQALGRVVPGRPDRSLEGDGDGAVAQQQLAQRRDAGGAQARLVRRFEDNGGVRGVR